jgi:hypothetical protein
MFVSSEEEYMPKKANSKHKELAEQIWKDKPRLAFSEILKQIGEITNRDFKQSKSLFFDQFRDKICRKVTVDNVPLWEMVK